MADTPRSVLTELLRLYDWRNELGRAVKEGRATERDQRRDLNLYGEQKKLAWTRARDVLQAKSSISPVEDVAALFEARYAGVTGMAKAAIAAMHDHPGPCTWVSPFSASDTLTASCGFSVDIGPNEPASAGYNFCPKCGHAIDFKGDIHAQALD